MNSVEGREMLNIGMVDPVRVNFLLAGTGGIGKTTFVNLLFKKYKDNRQAGDKCNERDTDTSCRVLGIEKIDKFILKSGNVDVHFHINETCGFGDNMNNDADINVLKEHLMTEHNKWRSIDRLCMTTKVKI